MTVMAMLENLPSRLKRSLSLPTLLLLGALTVAPASAQVLHRPMAEPPEGPGLGPIIDQTKPVEMSPQAQPTVYQRNLFGPDPDYSDVKYDAKAQLDVYGSKHAVPSQRPVIEWGYPLYAAGPLPEGLTLFGEKNLSRPQLLVYGDWRTAAAWNDNGKNHVSEIATRLNLDINLQLTATERFHAFFRPLDRGGQFTRYEFEGSNPVGFRQRINANPLTLFFEGDLGAITAGLTNEYQPFDLPFGLGRMPLFFQNGIWFNNAPIGGAFTIPAKNSPMLDITNMDFTFFASGDEVSTNALRLRNGALDLHAGRLYGMAGFVETHEGYLEYGYGYTEDIRPNSGFSYSNFTAAWTKRYWHTISNSIRFIGNFGQHPENGAPKTANGYAILVENSLITSLPSTLVPYLNGWVGVDHPQALARDAGAGGFLVNTGINFETDGLTGFPKLDDTGQNTWGGALGLEYLFDLDQQIVGELATVQTFDDPAKRVAKGQEYAAGIRYQIPINERFIFRADAMVARRVNDHNIAGVRTEFRWKF